MGNYCAEILEGLPPDRTIKIHARACSELHKLVIAVSKILPEIEAARPGCTQGREALSLLSTGIAKAKYLLQCCTESSVLYLALTGDAVVARCKKSRNILEQNLCQTQDMVPVVLVAKISGIVSDLRSASFGLFPPEEEAGKVLRELLHKCGSATDSTEEAALKAILTVSPLLNITSQRALLVEKRSIRKLLDRFDESKRPKRKILTFFLNLLSKYGRHITKEQKNNGSTEHEELVSPANPYDLTDEVELRMNYTSDETQIKMFSRPVPPEEFLCPLTSRLMYDPVVIASGQTYEKMWIQKWLDEGNDTCPKTKKKLTHLSFTSNTIVKDLVLKWCATHNVSIPDPKIIDICGTSVTSIVSLNSEMNDLNLPLNFCNLPFKSTQGSDLSHAKISNFAKPSSEIDVECFSEFSSLPWDSQRSWIEDFKRSLKTTDTSWSIVPFEMFIQLLIEFLKDAHYICDVKAQISGCLLLYDFVEKNRNNLSYLKEDTYEFLASFLVTGAAKQVLSILELLSLHQHCVHKIVASNVILRIVSILDFQVQDLLEPALRILNNLSSNGNIGSLIRLSNFIPKLILHFKENSLARYCITILKNLCNTEEARLYIVETSGCISSIAELLNDDSSDNQECAVYILLSLCLQRVLYCQLVMNEGVIPGLERVSITGNTKAKALAMELQRILKEESGKARECSGSEIITNSPLRDKDKALPRGLTKLFGKIFPKQWLCFKSTSE